MILVINGTARSGKDTFCSFIEEEIGKEKVAILSSVDLVKELATRAGWNGEKTPKNRKFLSDLKDLLTEWDDVPYKDMKRKMDLLIYDWESYGLSSNNYMIFVMCREPQEIQKFVDRLGAKTILVRRKEVENIEASNHADADFLKFKYNYEIDNNGSLAELREQARGFLKICGYRKEFGR